MVIQSVKSLRMLTWNELVPSLKQVVVHTVVPTWENDGFVI